MKGGDRQFLDVSKRVKIRTHINVKGVRPGRERHAMVIILSRKGSFLFWEIIVKGDERDKRKT